MSTKKYLITHSLLSSWEWLFKLDGGYEDFLHTLRREKTPPTQAMLDGNQFEQMVSARNKGAIIEDKHKWKSGIEETAFIVRGSAEQVKLSHEVTCGGLNLVLYGVLDNLRGGIIYDTKFSKTYTYGKYRDSTQHPMYFALCPGAEKFVYVIFNGRDVYRETYWARDTEPIYPRITQFFKWLDEHELLDIYLDKWVSKY